MSRVVSHHVEERFAHVEGGTIEHERVGALIDDPLADRDGVAGGDDVVPVVAQREGQQFGDLGRVVDEQNASRSRSLLAGAGARQALLLCPADGSRSNTHSRPPAV